MLHCYNSAFAYATHRAASENVREVVEKTRATYCFECESYTQDAETNRSMTLKIIGQRGRDGFKSSPSPRIVLLDLKNFIFLKKQITETQMDKQ